MTHKTEKVKEFHQHFHNWYLYISNMSTHGSIWNDKAFGTERTPFLLQNLLFIVNLILCRLGGMVG